MSITLQWIAMIVLLLLCSSFFIFFIELRDLWCAFMHKRYHRRMEVPRNDTHSIKHEGKIIGRRKMQLKKTPPIVLIVCNKCKTYFRLNKETVDKYAYVKNTVNGKLK